MRAKIILSLLVMSAAAGTFGINVANAGLPGLPGLPAPPAPHVNVLLNGYLPAPPGVSIQIYGGRPCYMEHGRRVYLKEKRYGKHHKGHGHKYGHYK